MITSRVRVLEFKGGKMADESSEQLWVMNAAGGDLEAFNQLVLSYQDIAYRHAYALVRDRESAEDITQDSFVKAFQKIGGFRYGSFRAWLLKIVTNTAYDRLRSSRIHPTIPLYPMDEQDEEFESPYWMTDTTPSVEQTVQQNDDARRLYHMLNELPGIYRTVITLIDLYEVDYAEAAEILDIPVGTVKSRLTRARLQMKDKLQRSRRLSFATAV